MPGWKTDTAVIDAPRSKLEPDEPERTGHDKYGPAQLLLGLHHQRNEQRHQDDAFIEAEIGHTQRWIDRQHSRKRDWNLQNDQKKSDWIAEPYANPAEIACTAGNRQRGEDKGVWILV